MSKNNRTRIFCFAGVSALLIIFGAVALTLAVTGEFDADIGLFTTASVFAPALYCVLLAAPVLGAVLWITFRRNSAADRPLPVNIPFMAASALSALAILAETGIAVVNSVSAVTTQYAVIQYLGWAFAVLCAASLLVNMFSDGKTSRVGASLLAFFPPLYCASRVLIMYFDKTVAVNSPIKLIFQLAFISFMLMFTAEAGISLGRGGLFCRYLFTLCCSVTIGGAVMIGSLAASLMTDGVFPYPSADIFAGLSLFLYSAVRLISVTGVELVKTEKTKKDTAAKASADGNKTNENI